MTILYSNSRYESIRQQVLGVGMKIKRIQSTKLQCLNGTTKDLINMGMWVLYKVNDDKYPGVVYFLEAEREYYLLNAEGKALSSSSKYPNELKYGARILFSDIPFSESIDNFKPAWA